MRVKKEKNDRESEYHRKGRKVVESLISIHLANSEPQCEFSQAVYPLAGLVFYVFSVAANNSSGQEFLSSERPGSCNKLLFTG